ncbi:MAG: Rieske 2Fe-2S domain-containing protein [Planctomycetota bacterium]
MCSDPEPAEANWTTVAQSEEVTQESPKEVIVGEYILAIFRDQGRLFALDGMCAHQGGPLAEGAVANGCVTCPWHGWQYELETGIQTINRQPLQRTFEVREQDGRIQVLLD